MDAPADKLLTPDMGSEGVSTVPVPNVVVHKPVPTAGAIPARVAVAAHTDWLPPGVDIDGGKSLVISTVEVEMGHTPLSIVHVKVVVVPDPREFTVEFGSFGKSTIPGPPEVHVPVSVTSGIFPPSVRWLHIRFDQNQLMTLLGSYW